MEDYIGNLHELIEEIRIINEKVTYLYENAFPNYKFDSAYIIINNKINEFIGNSKKEKIDQSIYTSIAYDMFGYMRYYFNQCICNLMVDCDKVKQKIPNNKLMKKIFKIKTKKEYNTIVLKSLIEYNNFVEMIYKFDINREDDKLLDFVSKVSPGLRYQKVIVHCAYHKIKNNEEMIQKILENQKIKKLIIF